MGKFWVWIVCLFGLTHDVLSVVASPDFASEILTVLEPQAPQQNLRARQVPQINIHDPESVRVSIAAVQNDCLRPTWEESQMVLDTYLKGLETVFFNAAKSTDCHPNSEEKFDLYETYCRKMLNALDIVKLRIINKKQDAAALAVLRS